MCWDVFVMSVFKHVELKLVSPSFDSDLTDTLMELNHLRKLELYGSTVPWTFFQLKEVFHLLESVGSARIEGNRTTISEYVEQKIEQNNNETERFSEIANIESAMNYIEEHIKTGTEISHHFIRELHHLSVSNLGDEGDRTPGSYRTWNVQISKSEHTPPEHHLVQGYMDELLDFINKVEPGKYDLLKTAIAHHRFTWVHPFGNGNGRVVRLLTYVLLIKYGFNVKDGKLLNPTAVFCNDRDFYYSMLSKADTGKDESLLEWCNYVLSGILEEIAKVNKLLDFNYLSKNILIPTINYSVERGVLNEKEETILKLCIPLQSFKTSDLTRILPKVTSRQIILTTQQKLTY